MNRGVLEANSLWDHKEFNTTEQMTLSTLSKLKTEVGNLEKAKNSFYKLHFIFFYKVFKLANNQHVFILYLKKKERKRQRRTLHNDQRINPRRRYNNYKYICTQHRSTAICKANANEYERGN